MDRVGTPGRTRRWLLGSGLAALGASAVRSRSGPAAPTEPALPETVPAEEFDFEAHDLARWTVVDGQWTVEAVPGAPSGRRALVQRAVTNAFNVIVAPPGPFTDVDVSVKLEPIAGREDASGGIVFRFGEGRYYVVRANALEDNVRLYAYERGRRQLASARVKAPAVGQWHILRVLAIGDRMQAWLDGAQTLDHRDARFKSGRVGLWTKADSITAFDDLTIRGVPA